MCGSITPAACRVVQRVFPSMFDMFGGNTPEDPEGFDEDAEFQRAVDLARGADVAVVVAGEWQNMIGEAASRSSLELPGRQLELLQAVVATGTPVVLLVMNGRPLDLRWAAEHVPAILDIWYPGTQGGAAVANLLFGDVSPGGKLPFTWPRTVGQVPMVYAHTRSHEPENQARRYWDEAEHAAVPVRARPELRPLRVRQPHRRPARHHHGRDGHRVGRGHQHRRIAKPTRSCSSTSTSGTARRRVRSASSRASSGSRSRPASHARSSSRSGPDERRYWNAAVRDWVTDPSTFDVWVGGDSTAQLSHELQRDHGVASRQVTDGAHQDASNFAGLHSHRTTPAGAFVDTAAPDRRTHQYRL